MVIAREHHSICREGNKFFFSTSLRHILYYVYRNDLLDGYVDSAVACPKIRQSVQIFGLIKPIGLWYHKRTKKFRTPPTYFDPPTTLKFGTLAWCGGGICRRGLKNLFWHIGVFRDTLLCPHLPMILSISFCVFQLITWIKANLVLFSYDGTHSLLEMAGKARQLNQLPNPRGFLSGLTLRLSIKFPLHWNPYFTGPDMTK